MFVKIMCFLSLIPFLVYANDKSIYQFEWMDQDKEIYVLQNRIFEKKQNFILSLLGSKTMSNKFVDTYYGVIKGSYFFNEDWGIELVGAVGTASENVTADAIRGQSSVPFDRTIENYFGAMAVWAPLYGKFNAFDKIFYLDWFLGAGAAAITTSDNRNEFIVSRSDRSKTNDSHVGFIWETGFLFYLSPSWMIRFEFQGIHFQADLINELSGSNGRETYDKTFYHHYDLNLGLAVKF